MAGNIASFSIADYIVFSLMLAGSLGIGVFFAIKGNKTTDDFLLASRSMKKLPVTMSLIATYFSSISILGYTGEVYGHGIQMVTLLFGVLASMIWTTFLVLPIFYELKLKSINEYIEMRFHSVALKKYVLVITSLNLLLYLGLCLYAPTLALESVTPLKSTTYVFVLGVVVTLYSSFGGLKAVVWTDVFQTVIIMVGVILVAVTSITKAGGLSQVWSTAVRYDRASAGNFAFGLYERHTVINTFINGLVNFSYLYCFSQATIQRVATLKSLRDVKLVMIANNIGLSLLVIVLFLGGMGVFAVYAGCDPLSLGIISKKDQILPLYVMEYLGFLKGVPGLFVACLFSGTLSSISSVLNSLPTMLWVDFLQELPYFKTAPERVKTIATKSLTIVCGVVMMCIALLSSRVGGLIQASITVLSIVAGPIMGVFVLGVGVPICGKKGAFAGLTVSILFMTWLAIGAHLHGAKTPMLPLSTDLCSNHTTSLLAGNATQFLTTLTSTTTIAPSPHPLAGLYDISYTLFAPIGLSICIAVAIAVTFATGREDLTTVDPRLVIHFLRRYVGPPSASAPPLKTDKELVSFISSPPLQEHCIKNEIV